MILEFAIYIRSVLLALLISPIVLAIFLLGELSLRLFQPPGDPESQEFKEQAGRIEDVERSLQLLTSEWLKMFLP